MVRKQVYITLEQEEKLKRLAADRGVTEAEVIRTALDALGEVTYQTRESHAGRVRETAVMERYVADAEGAERQGNLNSFQGRVLDAEAWREEVAFIKSLAAKSKGTTELFNREELYEERISKLLR